MVTMSQPIVFNFMLKASFNVINTLFNNAIAFLADQFLKSLQMKAKFRYKALSKH